MAKTVLQEVFNLTTADKDYYQKLFKCAVLLEIADNLSGGKMLNLSAPSIAEFIVCGRFGGGVGVELLSCCMALELYDKWLSGEVEKTAFPPDYIAKAKRLSCLAPFNESTLIKNFSAQIELIEMYGEQSFSILRL